MAYQQDLEDLGRRVEALVDRAVNSKDFQKLNQTVRQAVELAVDKGSEAVRRAAENRQKTVPEAAPQPPVLYQKTGKKQTLAIVKIAGGSILSVCSVPGLLLYLFSTMFPGNPMPMFPVIPLLLLAGGMGLLSRGVWETRRIGRFKTYLKTLGNKTYCTLERLARSVGKPVRFVRRELRKMLEEGLFLQGHLDREEKNLITSDETYRHYENSRLQLEQRQAQEQAQKQLQERRGGDPRLQEVLERGNAFLQKIRACNDAIPGEEISRKISRMEHIVEVIFRRAQEHPEVVDDLKKLMDYYLPMTVKLLDAYADMDAQPVQGQTIQNSKREIEQTLDTLNLAFEKLLDDLFRDTALDVSSDISVLNTLLAQEGLTEDELTSYNTKKEK